MRQKSRQKKRITEMLNKYRTEPLNQIQEATGTQAKAKGALLGDNGAEPVKVPKGSPVVSDKPQARITKMLDKYRTQIEPSSAGAEAVKVPINIDGRSIQRAVEADDLTRDETHMSEGGGGVGYLPIKTAAEAGEQDDPVTQADVTKDTNMSDEEIEKAAVEELNRWAELAGVPPLLIEQEEEEEGWNASTLFDTIAPNHNDTINLMKFMDALGGPESGWDPKAKNKRTGAYGTYQIMPNNWPSWSRKAEEAYRKKYPKLAEGAFGKRDSLNMFLVARWRMKEYIDKFSEWDPETSPTGDPYHDTAAAWYAGGRVDAAHRAMERGFARDAELRAAPENYYYYPNGRPRYAASKAEKFPEYYEEESLWRINRPPGEKFCPSGPDGCPETTRVRKGKEVTKRWGMEPDIGHYWKNVAGRMEKNADYGRGLQLASGDPNIDITGVLDAPREAIAAKGERDPFVPSVVSPGEQGLPGAGDLHALLAVAQGERMPDGSKMEACADGDVDCEESQNELMGRAQAEIGKIQATEWGKQLVADTLAQLPYIPEESPIKYGPGTGVVSMETDDELLYYGDDDDDDDDDDGTAEDDIDLAAAGSARADIEQDVRGAEPSRRGAPVRTTGGIEIEDDPATMQQSMGVDTGVQGLNQYGVAPKSWGNTYIDDDGNIRTRGGRMVVPGAVDPNDREAIMQSRGLKWDPSPESQAIEDPSAIRVKPPVVPSASKRQYVQQRWREESPHKLPTFVPPKRAKQYRQEYETKFNPPPELDPGKEPPLPGRSTGIVRHGMEENKRRNLKALVLQELTQMREGDDDDPRIERDPQRYGGQLGKQAVTPGSREDLIRALADALPHTTGFETEEMGAHMDSLRTPEERAQYGVQDWSARQESKQHLKSFVLQELEQMRLDEGDLIDIKTGKVTSADDLLDDALRDFFDEFRRKNPPPEGMDKDLRRRLARSKLERPFKTQTVKKLGKTGAKQALKRGAAALGPAAAVAGAGLAGYEGTQLALGPSGLDILPTSADGDVYGVTDLGLAMGGVGSTEADTSGLQKNPEKDYNPYLDPDDLGIDKFGRIRKESKQHSKPVIQEKETIREQVELNRWVKLSGVLKD